MAEQILSLLLYLILILTTFWFISPQKKPRSHPAYHLACLLEDAPESSLKGQFYTLATPLATPTPVLFPRCGAVYIGSLWQNRMLTIGNGAVCPKMSSFVGNYGNYCD
jgi:cbb3-type cytochrome oxidase subunit 3